VRAAMASDASSGDGHRPPNRAQPADEDPHAALTQELARLLAAAIAQKQAGRTGGLATGSELASLASLVAGATQRNVSPGFKDGLSSLSYTPAPAPRHDHPIHAELPHDDEPMPIPSTWRQPAAHDEDRWFRQQMGAAALGLGAGLLIVVPTVLWLSGWLTGAPKSKPAGTSVVAQAQTQTQAQTQAQPPPTDVKTVKVQVRPVERANEAAAAQFVTGSLEPPRAAEPRVAAALPTQPSDHARARIEEMVLAAKRRIDGGDILAAREMLADADGSAQGAAWFALAETYDPNMLAAWGTRGVTADVARARALYRKALEVGAPRAQARLDALK
jgi:hypothetical protein